MSRRGVWQLKRLVVSYCEFSGSSRGTKEFVESFLPRFVAENPQVSVETTLGRGRHPHLLGEYLNGTSRSVGLRNASAEEVLRQAALLRSSQGRKTSLQIKKRLRTASPSIQGPWTPELQDALKSNA